MVSHMPIRKKIQFGALLLAATLVLLAAGSLRGVFAYRELATMISLQADEPLAISKLQSSVADLRCSFRKLNSPTPRLLDPLTLCDPMLRAAQERAQNREDFQSKLDSSSAALQHYQDLLNKQSNTDHLLADRTEERQLARQIRMQLDGSRTEFESDSEFNRQNSEMIEESLNDAEEYVKQLPAYHATRMSRFKEEVRARYHTWTAFNLGAALIAFLIVAAAYWFFRHSVLYPFRALIAGSRTIARGNFEHRIQLESTDELSELADALNDMTSRFIEIRDHLNEKVQERTREVVRSEQLASVGFLAAGVAHEINNPLASIAWSAEALESRLHEILHPIEASQTVPIPDEQQLQVLRKYLKRIQDEAFRCKGITERLLDFSRLSESQRKQATDVNELVEDVIALVRHLAPYRTKRIEFEQQLGLTAWVSPPEFKQVVLNLLTNALDSTDDEGVVKLRLEHDAQWMRLVIEDNGCGMSDEVLKHLYEPFFTRRRDGKGTGLGLSITYRIVQDHGGRIDAQSDGPGCGSRFQIMLPLSPETVGLHEPTKRVA
ncbi:MAG: HAMP domain-containing sensor histidine kinase [Pirellulales bacterium]